MLASIVFQNAQVHGQNELARLAMDVLRGAGFAAVPVEESAPNDLRVLLCEPDCPLNGVPLYAQLGSQTNRR